MSTILLTPTLTGHDGLSCLTRQFVGAVASADADVVHVLALDNASAPEFSWPSHVRVTDCAGNRAAFMWRAFRAAARRRATPPTVVAMHLHTLPAAWPLLMRGATLLPVLVGVEAWCPLSWARRRVLTHARRALAISQHTATEFRKANPGFAALPIDVCWPATPAVGPVAAGAVRRPGFALIVGRLSSEDRYKGHDVLIDVWPEVRRAVPDARLVVAGAGDDQSRLRARAEAAGLGDAVDFAGGQTPAALGALYRDCAFLVMPSRHEGFGFVFLEAMAAGRACIGGPGAAQEIIVENSSGLIVDPDRPGDVRDALVRLFADPDLCARFGEAGRRRARDVFSLDRFERELLGHLAHRAPQEMVTTPC